MALLIFSVGGSVLALLIARWWVLPFLALLFLSVALVRGNDAPDTLKETELPSGPDWYELLLPDAGPASPREWLFWSLLICTALAALPLLFVRWTAPEGTLMSGALEGVALFAAPFLIALPFLLLGCVVSLVFSPATRNSTSMATLALSCVIVLAAVHAALTS